MKRLLYIDIAFTGIQDGGANRSKFLFASLCQQYTVDWLEIRREGIPESKELPAGINKHYLINAELDHRFWNPIMIFRFCRREKQKLRRILQENKYTQVFIRFLSPVRLADEVFKFDKNIAVAVDVDMLLSRLSRLSWERQRSFSNRYYLLETLKQERAEKSIFQRPYLFFLTNREERNLVLSRLPASKGDNVIVMPNVMQEKEVLKPEKKQRILFFGTLTSAANFDALHYLAEDIYPLLEPHLEVRDLYLDIAGKGFSPEIEQCFSGRTRLRYLGAVEDMQLEIAKSLLVFLPLRVASGTRTRLLEVASQAVPVVTTPIGVEGLELSPEEVLIYDNPVDLVSAVMLLLNNPDLRQLLGEKMKIKCRELYLAEKVSANLLDQLSRQQETKNAGK